MIIKIKTKIPDESSEQEVAEFCAADLSAWGGQFHPTDPLFHSLDVEYVQIGKNKYAPKG